MKMKMKLLPAAAMLIAAFSAAFAQEAKIMVLNPRGNPPPTPLAPMAERPLDLKGKTVYFIDIKYEGGASLLRAVMDWFSENEPQAKLVFREKAGSYDQQDEKLWAEIKEKGDAAVIGVGH